MSRQPLSRGDIVLVPFPFTDLSNQKIRPAVVISPDNGTDVILVFISSVIPKEPEEGDLIIDTKDRDFHKTGLKKSSVIKSKKIVTLERNIIIRRLGKISIAIQSRLDKKIARALGLTA
ncbi:MAG: type II toxin-antitoxin system PemK/MazF family toxin [Planctomycetes bacterium]|nr:type II toxin-antitoxin system PemK/MazF family toxin [Planctomycetota bacterium]